MHFANRMEAFGTGIFSVLLQKKQEKEAQGVSVIDLSVGTPNIPPEERIRQVLSQAALDPKSYVYAIRDTSALQKAATIWYRRRYGVELDPDTQVCSLMGSQEGLSHIALTVADPGDIVLVPDPCYPVFADGPRIAGAQLSYMPLRKENDYLIDFSAIDPETARRAKLMIVSYPNNPTCAIAPPSFYRELIEFARTYDIMVLHDNAYSELTFDGVKGGSFLSYPGAVDVGVEFNSLSKTYGMAGARVGFCLGNREMVEKLKLLKSNMDYGMFLPVQQAAIEAITGDQSCVERTRQAYQHRRDALCRSFSKAGWVIDPPKATMFAWAAIPKTFPSSQEFALALLEKTGVLVTPGSGFGPSGEGYVRLALVQDEDVILEAADRIAKSGLFQ
ncbi:MAG TPA: aminotransferase class I/II-fold pyridoxal phosphate-dependent enzyme [Firmicutes bacterium]|nr:aminotransferase class I/II-fold pyridoxal phosphate-dependent enzyme [Bacillota bacterium]